MKLGLHQSARLEQRLIQSPQMIQAMKILQLGALDLQERIEQELVENPMLEEHPDGPEDGATVDDDVGPAEETREGDTEQIAVESMLEDLERLVRDFGEGSRSGSGDGDEGDGKLQALANAPDLPKTMAEALQEELAFIDLTEHERELAEFLIFSLDSRGYLPEGLEALARQYPEALEDDDSEHPSGEEESERAAPAEHASRTEREAPESDENADQTDGDRGDEEEPELDSPSLAIERELAKVLERLRVLIHPGLGAHDLREALLLQIDQFDHPMPLLRTIVADHLQDVQLNRLPRIAKATGQPIESIKDALEHLRRLDPSPAADYGESVATVIVPDVLVEELDGEYVLRLDRARVPRLQLSATYRRLLQEAKKGDGTEAWLRKRLESARWFIDAVSQRQSTLERIAKVIFQRQRPFLDRGLSALGPLRMQEVADEVEVHISTVSRAVNGKYAQTPRGIFPLKFFFTGGTTKGNGKVASQVSIQQRIKELVESEDSAKPLSDEELSARLEEKDNIRIARRTVTKYRKMLNIPSSSQRRAF